METSNEFQVKKDIYWFLWIIQRLLDNGKTEDMDTIIDECDKGAICEYLFEKYRIGEQDNPFSIESKNINYLYSKLGSTIGYIKRKYDVYSNGLVYLSAIAIEWLYTGFSHLYQ